MFMDKSLRGSGLGKNASRMPGMRMRKLPGHKNPVGGNGPVAGGIYRSISFSLLSKSISKELIRHAKMDHNRQPIWPEIQVGEKVLVTINNPKSRTHGMQVVVEKLKNGLFRVLNEDRDIKKSFVINPQEEVLYKSENSSQKTTQSLVNFEEESEYDEYGRPTPFLMALYSVGIYNKKDAMIKSKKERIF